MIRSNNDPLPCGIVGHVSPSMMSRHALDTGFVQTVRPVTRAQARMLAPAILAQFGHSAQASCVGYANSAAVISAELAVKVPQNRANVAFEVGDSVLLAHLSGARLEPFAETLPEGTHLRFYLVSFEALP